MHGIAVVVGITMAAGDITAVAGIIMAVDITMGGTIVAAGIIVVAIMAEVGAGVLLQLLVCHLVGTIMPLTALPCDDATIMATVSSAVFVIDMPL